MKGGEKGEGTREDALSSSCNSSDTTIVRWYLQWWER